jgi:hypothetical protein
MEYERIKRNYNPLQRTALRAVAELSRYARSRKMLMLTLKRLLTLGPCLVLLSLLLVFDTFVGGVLCGVGGSNSGTGVGLLVASGAVGVFFSIMLTFGGAFPWCREKGQPGNKILNRASAVIAVLIIGISLYFYLTITILDKEPQKIQLVKEGMTKAQVVDLIGPPDWEEAENLWAYRVRGDGISGVLFPYYVNFDANGELKFVYS